MHDVISFGSAKCKNTLLLDIPMKWLHYIHLRLVDVWLCEFLFDICQQVRRNSGNWLQLNSMILPNFIDLCEKRNQGIDINAGLHA